MIKEVHIDIMGKGRVTLFLLRNDIGRWWQNITMLYQGQEDGQKSGKTALRNL